MKAVINDVLASNIENDHCGARKLIPYNRHDFPKLFAIIFEEIKFIGGVTYIKNIIFFYKETNG